MNTRLEALEAQVASLIKKNEELESELIKLTGDLASESVARATTDYIISTEITALEARLVKVIESTRQNAIEKGDDWEAVIEDATKAHRDAGVFDDSLAYGITVSQEGSDFVVHVRDLPEVVTSGDCYIEAMALAYDAVTAIVEHKMDKGTLSKPSGVRRDETPIVLSPDLQAKMQEYFAAKTR